MERFLEAFHSETFYRDALTDPDIAIFVAEAEKDLCGYMLIKPNSLPCDPPRPEALEISRLYISVAYQSQGIAHGLMKAGLDDVRRKGAPSVTLSVFSENFGAQRFYARHGFSKIGDNPFIVGDHIDEDWIYALTL